MRYVWKYLCFNCFQNLKLLLSLHKISVLLIYFCRNAVVGIFFLLVLLTLILIFWPRKTVDEELAGSTVKKVSKLLNPNFHPCLQMHLVLFHLTKEIYFVHFPYIDWSWWTDHPPDSFVCVYLYICCCCLCFPRATLDGTCLFTCSNFQENLCFLVSRCIVES